jgi:hypothetical protein
MKLFKKNHIIFTGCFFGLIVIYHYLEIYFLRPQSMHLWRQTDCLSLALNYYEHGMHFFSPEIHNQLADGGDSGYSAGEFPILYYFVALVWKVFGYHEFYYRLIVTLISFCGFFALYKTMEGLLKDTFWGITISLLIFTSPILVYYSANFLTNIPALSFSLIGWYFFYKFYEVKQSRLLYISMLFFMLAALLKIPEAINFLLVTFIYFVDVFTKQLKKRNIIIFQKPFLHSIPFILFAIGVFSWYAYAKHFNDIHNGKYTFNDIWPIWRMTKEQIKGVYDFVTKIMMYQLFHNSVFYLCVSSLVIMLLSFKMINKLYFSLLFLFFLGSCTYLILWFNALDAHDYYLINILIWPAFILLVILDFVKRNYPSFFFSKKIKFLFTLFVILNIAYCSANIKMRYWIGNNNTQFFATDYEKGYWWYTNDNYKNYKEALGTIEPYNRSLGILATDKIICMPDPSINISLYLMHQKGFTDYGNLDLVGKDRIIHAIAHGAKYLFVIDKELLKQDYLMPFTTKKIGEYRNILIYDLRTN